MKAIRRIRGAAGVIAGLAVIVALAVPASAGAATPIPAAGSPARAGYQPAPPGAPVPGPARATGPDTGPVPGAAVPSLASGSWRVQTTANGQAYENQLLSISCATATSCMAVGYDYNGVVTRTLAESWNGKKWTIQPTPNPSSTGNSLAAVSCTAVNACVAVGNQAIGSGGNTVTLAEVWNGSTWTIQATADAGGLSLLDGVSCTAADACEAVGYYEPTSGPDVYVTLAEAWNGSTWTVQSTPNPPSNGNFYYLYAVSCSAANACEAVGEYDNYPDIETIAEVWNGATWTVQSTPNLSQGGADYLYGVSCTAAGACIAVGAGFNGSAFVTLAEGWNGAAWAILPTPSHTVANSELLGVSCIAASSCVAVGYFDNGSGTSSEDALAEDWNGTTWGIQSTPTNIISGLTGVSCTTASSCVSSGNSLNSSLLPLPLAEVWNGSRWAAQSPPVPSTDSDLAAVSCTAPTSCLAVGDYYSSGTANMLAELWTGASWLAVSPPSGANIYPEALSCTAANSCMAVGLQWNGSAYQTVAESWNGSNWTLESPPDPGASGSELYGVSCTAASACTAVGQYENGSDALTLVEDWNGTSWAVKSSPNPAGATQNNLYSVSCTSASACEAVGASYAGPGDHTLAEAWNGKTWRIQPTPNRSGATSSYLQGVSCTAAHACQAVGYSISSSTYRTMAQAWNGTKWALKTTPNPGSAVSQLFGVSCGAAGRCVAVGNFDNGSGNQTLAETWNGTTWAAQSPPDPPGATNSGLAGVSCTAAAACAAVGDYYPISGIELTLAEAEGGD